MGPGVNVAPRGLWVTHPDTGALVAPQMIWHQGQTVRKVYSHDGTDWHIAWAREPESPAWAAAEYTPSQVLIVWDQTKYLAADVIEVRRSNGTLIGTFPISAGLNGVVDSSPVPVDGSYSVTGRLAGDRAAPTRTSVIDLNMDVSALTSTLVNPGATDQMVQLNWTLPTLRPANWTIYETGGSGFSVVVPGTATTWTGRVDGTAGRPATFIVRPTFPTGIGVDPTNLVSTTVNVKPEPTRGVGQSGWSGLTNGFTLNWLTPPGACTGYRVTWRINGGTLWQTFRSADYRSFTYDGYAGDVVEVNIYSQSSTGESAPATSTVHL